MMKIENVLYPISPFMLILIIFLHPFKIEICILKIINNQKINCVTLKSSIMKKSIILCLFTLIFTVSLSAQSIKGGAGFLKLGYANMSKAGSTLDKIAPEGIKGFTNDFVTIGAEGYYRHNCFIFALDCNMGAQKAIKPVNSGAEAFYGAGLLKIGMVVSQEDNYWIYPSIGAGSSFLVMTTYDKVGSKTENISNKALFNPTFDFGLNADFLLNKTPESGKFGSWILGVRTGYRASFENSNWRDTDGNKINGLPAYANNGFYVSLTIGGGGFVRN